ncbi:MAG TPA: sugar phosphate isomerase/epimerase family protein [Candidatus Lokiarchaeia archaeon]|nr:sugar phosphate isomerase/epimerase family protein [Candidatus Lokiarchaeia archaeon]
MASAILTTLSDEFSLSLSKALKQLQRFPQVRHVDLRGVLHKNVINLAPNDVLKVKTLLQEHGNVAVECIGSPVGKRKVPTTEEERADAFSQLQRALQVGQQLGAPFLRVFAFHRDPTNPSNYEQAVALVQEFGRMAEKAGIDLALENEGGYWGELPAEMDQLLRDVDSPRVWNLLDPGNHLQQKKHVLTEEDVALLAPRTKYLHVKDVNQRSRKYVVVGTGDVHYSQIFQQLYDAGVEPVICLETHMGGLFRGRTSAKCMSNLVQLVKNAGYECQ